MVKFSLCLINHPTKKIHWGMEAWFHIFLAMALDGGHWSALLPCETAPDPTSTRMGALQNHSGYYKVKHLLSLLVIEP